jgi:oxygen-independent coproporphyrinogen-3 oxidase
MLREHGVDRLSFGAQSFDPAELKLLERHHNPDDVPRSVEIAREAGFTRLNLDLIFGIPGQTIESWSRSLEAALTLGTPSSPMRRGSW